MPPADNDPIAPSPDGKKLSLGKRFLDRVKGPKSTKSSSASSTPTTQLMEIRTASSVANEKPSLSNHLLAPFKGSKFSKSSSTPSTPAAQLVENLAETQLQLASPAPGASAAQPAANVLGKPPHSVLIIIHRQTPGLVTAPAVPRAFASAQVVTAGTASAMNIDQGSPVTPAAAGPTSAMSVDQRGSVAPAGYTAAAPTSPINVNQHSSPTAVPSLVVSQKAPAMNPVSLTNIDQSGLPGPNVPQAQSKLKGLYLEVHVLTVNHPTEGVNVALDGCLTVLKVAKEASDWNPFLKAALGGVMAAIDLANTVSGNSEDMKSTMAYIRGLLPILEASAKRLEDRKGDFGKGNNLMTFAITVQTELEKVWEMQSHGLFRRVLQGPKDATTLLDVYKNISESLEQFKSDTVDRRACTPGTRVDVLKGILSWLQQPDGEPVYWLTGPAGIGKTTVAKTICELVDDRYNDGDANWSMYHGLGNIFKLPLVSYFCSRQLDSGESGLLVPTLCRRLCDHSSSYAACLAEVLEKDSEMAHATLYIQLIQMLIQPWKASVSERLGLPPLIIVIDALDENQSGPVFLKHLLCAVGATRLSGLKLFVTSREDEEISNFCSTLPQGTVLHLQDIQKQIVQDDIGLYLAESMSGLHSCAAYHKLIKKLIKLSNGLFIFAATAVKIVKANDTTVDEQVVVLQEIIDHLGNNVHLDALYAQIVKDAVSHPNSSVQTPRLQVLHTILCAMHPISDIVVAQLTKTTVEVVALVLKKLHPVMYKAHDGMIYTYHASFADYIHQTPKAAEIAFNPHCDVGLYHGLLAKRCYEIMEGQLCFNICGLESSFVKDADIPDLEKHIKVNIDSSLKYAALKWMAHLNSTSDPEETLQNKPQQFVKELLLFWVEVVNLLNARRECMQRLDMLKAWIDKCTPKTLSLWEEALKFCQFFFSGPASQYTPHLYVSALSCWNPKSEIAKIWQPQFCCIPKVTATYMSSHLLTIQTAGLVYDIGVSPNGKQVVSGGRNRLVCIWDALSGDLIKELKGHTDLVWSVAFSPDGKQVVSGSHDKSVRMWNALTGDLDKELMGHTDSVRSVAFSPDGKQVVSGSYDKSVRIWNALTGDLVKELNKHTDSVRSVAFSPDGKQVVSGGYDKSVHIWDALTGGLVKELNGHTDLVLSVAFSPDGKQVVSGSDDESVCIWNALTGDLVKELKGHAYSVLSVAFSPDGKQVVSGSDDESVRIWDALTGDLIKELKGHTDSVQSVSFSPDGKQVVSGSDDGSLRIWDALTGDFVKELNGHTDSVWSVGFSPDGKQVVSGSNDKSVCIWNALTGDLIKEFNGHTDWVRSVAFSPDGKQVVSGSCDKSVCIWDILTGDLVKELKGHTYSLRSVAFSPDGKQVVSGSVDRSVRIWDALTGDHVKELNGHTDSVRSVAFSPDGKQVVSGSNDRSVCIWNALTGDLVKQLNGHTDSVWSVGFSSDGKQVVSGSFDKSVCIWDALTGGLVKELNGHTDLVLSVAFSPDGKQVVSGSYDKSVCIWDALTGDLVKELKGHTDSVLSVAFSPDGKHVVSGSDDKSVRIWDAFTGDLAKELKEHTYSELFVAGNSDKSLIIKTHENALDIHLWLDLFTISTFIAVAARRDVFSSLYTKH
ncbi:hypothetical protein DXG01_014675 [Tephrocybe rancida]|nr:hypothetical protein DXG01_014675 [Tephrocybe rancida]